MERAPRYPFLLPIILLLMASGIVTPVISMLDVNGKLGHSVHFDIPVPLPSQYRIDWNFGHAGKVTVIAKLTNGKSPQYNPLYKGRCELFLNGTLSLNNIAYEDEGTYKLKLFNPENFSSYVQRYHLTVDATLSAPVLSSNNPFISGTNVTLQCDAGNQDVTTYTFYRGQNTICSQPNVICRGSFLDFTPISETDTGSYTCTIQNSDSNSTSNSVQWTVVTPVSLVMLSSNKSGPLRAGKDSVSLDCSAQGSDIIFSWRLNGNPVSLDPPYLITQSASPPKSTLTISPVSRKDIGPFTCTASNSANNMTSNELNLSLNWYPEENVACTVDSYDSMLHLECSWPGGKPAANVTMIFNNTAETGQNKVVRNVPLGQTIQRSHLTCIGNHLGKTFSCRLIFGTPQSTQDENNSTYSSSKREGSKSKNVSPAIN